MFFLLVLVSCVFQSAYADSPAAIKDIQGEVFLQPAGSSSEKWNAVTQETAVNDGDSVKTGNGSCVLSYADQADFRLGANTSLTITQQTDTQDIHLKLGTLKANVNEGKVIKPFQVVTPTAVAAVRGTEVDFYFNDAGQLIIDLHNGGPLLVYNDEAGMDLNLAGNKTITITYGATTGVLTVQNAADSDGDVQFTINGQTYTASPGSDPVSVNAEPPTTAGGGNNPPSTQSDSDVSGETVPDEDNPPPPDSNPPLPVSPV